MSKTRKKKPVTLAQFNGDHGTGTLAAMSGTRMEEIKTDTGANPNRMARRKRINRIEDMSARGQLNLRQFQAAQEISNAWCAVQMLSSGGEVKERVQSSPKPDATVARQVDAMSRLEYAMRGVPSAMRYVVEHVCWHNQPIAKLNSRSRHGNHSANLKVALDMVANKMRY